jgi:ABC-2 type transport system permease protein
MMLSGFLSPFVGMPDWAKVIAYFLPLTHIINLLKGIMIKGYAINDLLFSLFSLVLLLVAFITLVFLSYRNKLD